MKVYSLVKVDALDNLFDNFLKGPTIFRNHEVLHPDYVPENLPHRDKEIQIIGKILAPALRGYRGSNVFIYGKTGTGKTAAVRYTLDRLIRKSREVGAPIDTRYINCRIAGTDYRVLSLLCETVGVIVPFTGLATGEVLDRFRNTLDIKKLTLIVILDEIDALIKMHGDVLLYKLTRINENLKGSRVLLIGISNDLHFKEFLDPRVLSSLSEEEIVFHPYTAVELADILSERAGMAFIDGAMTEGALRLCSAFAASEHGDARRALDLIRVAGELAERGGVSKVSEEHVRHAQKKIEEDRVVEVLKTLPIHSKLVLLSVYLIAKSNVEGSITGDVFEVYKELCGQLTLDSLTQRRVSGLINELDVVGILNARLVNLGRYGRTKKIRLGISNDSVKEVYSIDSWIGSLVNYMPKYLHDAKKKL